MQPFQRVTPEEVGISSRDILSLLRAYLTGDDGEETHSFLLLRHGKLVTAGAFAPYSLKDRRAVFFGSKLFAGVAAGFAMAEGLFALDDVVADYFPELLPPNPPSELFRIKVRHLLTMTVGQAGEGMHEGSAEKDWGYAFFRRKCEVEPGREFRCDGHATYMLSRLVLKTSGKDLLEYLTPRLFEPMEMEVPPCIRDEGVSIDRTGMRLTLGEYARMGQLFLNGGVWNGKEVLPRGFAEEALLCHISCQTQMGEDWSEGYCYRLGRGQHGTYRFCGALGQMCVVMPEYDAVFCVHSGYDNPKINKELEKFYELLMTKFSDEPLPADEEGNRMLEDFIARLAVPERYATPSPMMGVFSGRELPVLPGSPYVSARLDFASNAVTVTLTEKGGDRTVFAAGLCHPMQTPVDCRGIVVLGTDITARYSSTALFTGLDTVRIKTHITETPTNLYVEMDYAKNEACVYTRRGNFDKK